MKLIISLIAILALGGCVTTSQSKSEYQAEIAGLQAEKAALAAELAAIHAAREAVRAQYELLHLEWQRSEGRRAHRPQ